MRCEVYVQGTASYIPTKGKAVQLKEFGESAATKAILNKEALPKEEKSLIKGNVAYVTPKGKVVQVGKVDISKPAVLESGRFEAIGFARFLASIHIVLGHMNQGGHIEHSANFYLFGYTWVPWFFMLSGYILSVAEDNRRHKNEVTEVSLFNYIHRRLENIYPPYILAIVSSIITEWSVKGHLYLSSAAHVMVYCLLMQSWLPSILEQGLTYLVQCWFLSCLFLYWMIFHTIYKFVSTLSVTELVLLTITCSVIVPVSYELASVGHESWFATHNYGSTGKGVDIAVLVLKFHPLTYIHTFALGCCLPRIRELLRGTLIFANQNKM
jgi:peptidoglycan/LPS O-acetylase OafA/YrhL